MEHPADETSEFRVVSHGVDSLLLINLETSIDSTRVSQIKAIK